MNLKKNDTVVVLSGKDKGKQGKVLSTMPKRGKVVVEGINMADLPRRSPASQGEDERHHSAEDIPMRRLQGHAVCPKCGKATRVRLQVLAGRHQGPRLQQERLRRDSCKKRSE